MRTRLWAQCRPKLGPSEAKSQAVVKQRVRQTLCCEAKSQELGPSEAKSQAVVRQREDQIRSIVRTRVRL